MKTMEEWVAAMVAAQDQISSVASMTRLTSWWEACHGRDRGAVLDRYHWTGDTIQFIKVKQTMLQISVLV